MLVVARQCSDRRCIDSPLRYSLSPSQLSSSSLAVKVTKAVANDSGAGALFPLPSFFSPIFSLSEKKQLIAA
ncbi:hypothetical protein U1Q18_027972 [Sarracenia purpurea var. burkii]